MLIERTKLSPQQEQALALILKWYESKEQCFVLAGYAGAGKSTLAMHIADILPGAVFSAYTGKAAHVLRQKGAQNACTIHGLMYQYEGKDAKGDPFFSLKDKGKRLVIVDEYSMLGKDIVNDLKLRCEKILFLGDPAQLPPIKKDNDPKLEPDFFLTEIHRQALDNPIIKWAHEIRNGKVPRQPMQDNCFVVKRKSDITEQDAKSVEQIIVGANKTRRDINLIMREEHGFSDISNLPLKGEKLICLQNNHKKFLFNGMIFNAESNAKNWQNSQYSLFVDGEEHKVWDGDVLGHDPKTYDYNLNLERFDYAYAITCHKAQGSEFSSVLIFNEGWGDTYLNWLYTAVTRAKERCILAI